MDLSFTPAEEEFRAEARAWLESHHPGPLASFDTSEGFEEHRIWEKTMAADRWSVVNWPREYGGRDASVIEWLIFEEEYWHLDAPKRVSQNGIALLAPTMLEYGTEEQKARFLPPMARAEEIWCQGWSEPDAGSDLAAIRATAVQTGGMWRLGGQKTWSSRASFADWCFGIFRTGPDRHRGLTWFLFPLDSPGVTVRPITQLDGETGFAEIFLDNVEVPDFRRLGPVDGGWAVAMSTAGSERGLNLRSPARYTEAARRLVDLWCSRGRPALHADAVVSAVLDAEAYRLHTWWTACGNPCDASGNKIFWSETDLAIHETAMAILGREVDDEWLDGYLFSLAGPIYAGTNEIQRNVVAERTLGLPR